MAYPISQEKQKTNKTLDKVKKCIDDVLDNVIIKPLFSDYGFYQNDHMFGIFQSKTFYLRAEETLASDLEKLGCKVSHNNKNQALSNDYYSVPLRLMQDTAVFKSILTASIEQLADKKQQVTRVEKRLIRQLINLSYKHERPLSKVGIRTVECLKRVGAVHAYILLKQHKIKVTLQFFWNLHAALLNIPVGLLTEEQQHEAYTTFKNRDARKWG
ncbi:TfoX/Sxy family DNA transformation protein [Pasteurellaceae bacterium 20609_3]|uniref:TfoX/Sxy family protein n=1 Tax=Spirabiliibacterium mucosae TaxID=28156 RepID=UPI001AAC80CA|nr:TfoX/Sxy family protein [Spirabiliibacterium mucosae]MBE2899173.1 TfoX/Sxy family DNA transformation protein [Spirabiliibacterium mucosae]